MKSFFLILITFIFLISCEEQVKDENRIEQVYKFNSINIHEYGKPNLAGMKSISGTINFNKKNIKIQSNINTGEDTDIYTIKTVTLDDSPYKLKYLTNKGTISIELKNGTIVKVWLFNRQGFIDFRK